MTPPLEHQRQMWLMARAIVYVKKGMLSGEGADEFFEGIYISTKPCSTRTP
jgi:asparagine synthetase B (glutamine-hydrolysing)